MTERNLASVDQKVPSSLWLPSSKERNKLYLGHCSLGIKRGIRDKRGENDQTFSGGEIITVIVVIPVIVIIMIMIMITASEVQFFSKLPSGNLLSQKGHQFLNVNVGCHFPLMTQCGVLFEGKNCWPFWDKHGCLMIALKVPITPKYFFR